MDNFNAKTESNTHRLKIDMQKTSFQQKQQDQSSLNDFIEKYN